ncbi:putative phage abortive infection protein [Serratia marcescens]|uniref:putative phage abortive infection protein n=1 Tax=Serratia marcescens TaxID=615 RepID=UPI0016511DD1|nr:putative phage abortive infection protein [Serratia marcescens]
MRFLKALKDKLNAPYIISVFMFILIIVACAAYFKFIGIDPKEFDSVGLEKKGQMGDSWGMFTSIFSALAFGGLISTLVFQSASISQAKKESTEQDVRYKKQQVENTFFRMLDIHFDLVKEMDLKNVNSLKTVASGKDTFTIFYKRLERFYNIYVSKEGGNEGRQQVDMGVTGYQVIDSKPGVELDGDELAVLMEPESRMVLTQDELLELYSIQFMYDPFWKRYRSDLGHYFRFLFNLIKYVDNADINDEEKYRYVKIVRAQLTDYEIVIIFYNALSTMSFEKFKPLIEKYTLLNNLPEDLLFDVSHKKYFNESAFNVRCG